MGFVKRRESARPAVRAGSPAWGRSGPKAGDFEVRIGRESTVNNSRGATCCTLHSIGLPMTDLRRDGDITLFVTGAWRLRCLMVLISFVVGCAAGVTQDSHENASHGPPARSTVVRSISSLVDHPHPPHDSMEEDDLVVLSLANSGAAGFTEITSEWNTLCDPSQEESAPPKAMVRIRLLHTLHYILCHQREDRFLSEKWTDHLRAVVSTDLNSIVKATAIVYLAQSADLRLDDLYLLRSAVNDAQVSGWHGMETVGEVAEDALRLLLPEEIWPEFEAGARKLMADRWKTAIDRAAEHLIFDDQQHKFRIGR